MIAVGLLLAFQVSVNVDVNKQGASAGIGVKSPLAERIPVTDELRRTAFKDAAARELLLRARASRLQQDSMLLSYDVKSYQRMSVGMSIREAARDRLAFRTESAARVRWHRATGARVEMLGARSAAPIVAGLREAEDEIEADRDLNDMMAIPYYPGKDELWLFEMIGGSDSEDEGRAMLVHPVAEGSEAYFTFASGDSVLMTLPDGKRITLRELRVIPREARWNLVVGSFWFETERAHLVRAVMRFSAPMDIWERAQSEDPDVKDDVPWAVRGFLTPMKAEVTAVTIEYGLLNQRFWLPRTQGAEGYARVSFMRVPFKIEERYRYESVNGLDSLPAIPAPRFKSSSELRDSLKEGGADTTAIRALGIATPSWRGGLQRTLAALHGCQLRRSRLRHQPTGACTKDIERQSTSECEGHGTVSRWSTPMLYQQHGGHEPDNRNSHAHEAENGDVNGGVDVEVTGLSARRLSEDQHCFGNENPADGARRESQYSASRKRANHVGKCEEIDRPRGTKLGGFHEGGHADYQAIVEKPSDDGKARQPETQQRAAYKDP